MDGWNGIKLAGMLLAVGVLGCAEPYSVNQPWGAGVAPMARPVIDVNEPAMVDTSPELDAEPSSTDQTSIPAVADKIQQYVGCFPSDNTERKASPPPTTPAQPAVTERSVGEPAPPTLGQQPALVQVAAQPTRPQAPVQPAATPAPLPETLVAAQPAEPKVTVLAIEEAKPAQEPKIQPKVELVAVRPAALAQTPRSENGTQPNQPVEPIAQPAGDSLTATIERLEEAVEKHPEQLDDLYKLVLLHLSMEGDEKASAAASKADPIRGDLIAAIVDVIRSTRQAVREPGASGSSALQATERLRTLLAQRSSVSIAKMAFVTSVTSFGVYQEVPARFAAGQGVHVFLYTEVGNFRSKPTGDGRLKTMLSESVEIFDADGNVIWRQSHPDIQDVALTPRRDFFIPLEIKLPAETPPGEYTLKVKIEDKIGLTTDQRRLTFTVGNP